MKCLCVVSVLIMAMTGGLAAEDSRDASGKRTLRVEKEVRHELVMLPFYDEVLPVSPNDDQIRIAVYPSICGTPGLDRYAMRAMPSIHIIVKNGHVFLEGRAATEKDKNFASLKPNGVSGVFSVTDNLHLDRA